MGGGSNPDEGNRKYEGPVDGYAEHVGGTERRPVGLDCTERENEQLQEVRSEE